MSPLSPAERRYFEDLWQNTRWEHLVDSTWMPLPNSSPVPLIVVSAWNPGSARLDAAINHARDRVLLGELEALGLSPQRARGRNPDGLWSEDGWLIEHLVARTTEILRRYGQIAGWVTGPGGSSYQWATDPAAG